MRKSILLIPVILFSGCWQHYSQGERVGIPYKLSHKGLFCKTWEGTANLGGMREQSDGKSTTMIPNTWNFTIRDEDISKWESLINTASEKGQTLKFQYDQEAFPVCHSDDGYFVTNVQVVKP